MENLSVQNIPPVGLNTCTMYNLYICCTYIIKTAAFCNGTTLLGSQGGGRPTCDSYDEERGEERGSGKMESPGPGK